MSDAARVALYHHVLQMKVKGDLAATEHEYMSTKE